MERLFFSADNTINQIRIRKQQKSTYSHNIQTTKNKRNTKKYASIEFIEIPFKSTLLNIKIPLKFMAF